MRDYHATLKIQQGRIVAAMRETGIATAAELSRASGVSQTEIGRLLNFRRSPRTKYGEWRAPVIAICNALCSEPSDIFPEHLDHEMPTNKIDAFADRALMRGACAPQLGPREECDISLRREVVDGALGELTAREERVIRWSYLEQMPLRDIGREIGVTAGRVDQIQRKAIEKLGRSKGLAELVNSNKDGGLE